MSRNGVAERDRQGEPRQLGRKKRRRETLVEEGHHSTLSLFLDLDLLYLVCVVLAMLWIDCIIVCGIVGIGGTDGGEVDASVRTLSTSHDLYNLPLPPSNESFTFKYSFLGINNTSSLFGFSCKGDDVIVDCGSDVIIDGSVCEGGGASSSDWCFGNLKALWSCSLPRYCQGYRQANGGDGGEDGGGGGGGGARDDPGPGGGPGGGEAGEDKNVVIYSFYQFPPEIPSDVEMKHVVLVGPYQDDEASDAK